MKVTKLTMAVAAATALTALSVSAQAQTTNNPNATNSPTAPTNRPNPVMRMTVDGRLEHLTKVLDLTEDQKPKVKAVLEEENKAMREARSSMANATPDERRAKGQAIHEETSAKLKNILTPEQYTKYEAMPQPRPAVRRPLAPGNPPGNAPAESNDKK